MKIPFAALLQPTRFDDEAQDLRAATLHLALLVLIGGGVAWAAVTMLQDDDPSTRMVLVAAGLAAEVVALIVLRRRHPGLAAGIVLGALWLCFTIGGWFGGGLGRSLGAGYLMLTVLSGVLMGGRGAIVGGVLAFSAVQWLSYAESQAWLPEPRLMESGVMPVMLVVSFASVALFLYMADRNLRGVLRERADQRREIEASRERYRVLTENTVALVSELDSAGQILYVSPQHRERLGWDPEELVGHPAAEFVHPDDQALLVSSMRRILESGEPITTRYRVRARDGEWRHLESGGRAYTASDGSIRIIVVSMDSKERVRAEAALQELEAQLRISQRMESLGRLAGGVAHDFNNLLTVILGSARWLERHPDLPPEDVREFASGIVQSAQRSADLTRQLLAFSRKQLVETCVLDLDERIDDLARILKSLAGDEINLVTVTHPGRHFVEADPSQIELIVVNLVANACDAMPKGGTVSIHTGKARIGEHDGAELPAGEYVRLEVEDDGIGMSEATRLRIFEPFFTTKEMGSGTGLGLSTVYGIVSQGGGQIRVNSEPGQGSRFQILLPLVEQPTSVPDLEHRVEPTASGRGERLLLAEDEPAVRQFTRRLLEEAGYCVTAVSNGVEALERMGESDEEYELLVTDVAMPEMGGVELAQRCTERDSGFPVVFVSGYTDPELAKEGLRIARSRWLKKPFAPEELLARVRQLLDAKAQGVA
ncbi:MAG: response regulator [Deltaproteobacteria bacterium]|nr:response regulator [Deltaproteobacteria bacterium]